MQQRVIIGETEVTVSEVGLGDVKLSFIRDRHNYFELVCTPAQLETFGRILKLFGKKAA